jgi:hypothetical protein
MASVFSEVLGFPSGDMVPVARAGEASHPLPPEAGYCVLIDDFFTAQECEALIARMAQAGFGSAASDYPPSYRDNERRVWDDAIFAQRLFARLSGRVPPVVSVNGERWRLQALNPRLRACRYRAGQQFRIHQDGVHHVDAQRRSLLTFMIYLDGAEAFDGGDTVFFAGGPRARDLAQPAVIARVRPRRGSLIVFDHALWHAGETVTRGCKHVLRSDLIYACEARCDSAIAAPFSPGHRGYVWTLQALPGGRIASGGRDRAIRLWRHDGHAAGVLRGHTQSVLGLASAGEGRLASVSRDRDLRIWDLATGQCILARPAHAAAALCVVDTGHGLASGGADHTIAQWDRDGSERARWTAHAGWVWALAWLGDDRLASVSEDGSVALWDTNTQQAFWRLRGSTALRAIAAWQGEQGVELAIGDEQGWIAVWRIAGDRVTPVRRFRAHAAALRRLRYLDGGRLVSGGEDGKILRWRDDTSEPVAERDNFVTDFLALSATTLLSCGYDGQLGISQLG